MKSKTTLNKNISVHIVKALERLHYPLDVILVIMRWHIVHACSLRVLEAMVLDRGMRVGYSTIHRWVTKFAPLFEKIFRDDKHRVKTNWHVHETYMCSKGNGQYYYRAIDQFGDTVDFLFVSHQDQSVALRFFNRAIPGLSETTRPSYKETDVLVCTLHYAQFFLKNLSQSKVCATATLEELQARLQHDLADEGMDPSSVIDELITHAQDGLLGNVGGRFFGWVTGGTLPAALAADWLTSTWDQNAATYTCSPAQSVIEEVCGQWIKELLCLPKLASFAITTGSQMGHMVALAVARHAQLRQRAWNVEEQGLQGAPKIRIITSDMCHGSIERAVQLLGLGKKCIHILPADENGKLPPAMLHAALERDTTTATIVVLQAGDLHFGAFDCFAQLIPLAHSYGAWVHIDGAFGLWVSASPMLKHFTTAVQYADSWVLDGHKWLNVPYGCGYVFVADAASHVASFSNKENYLFKADNVRNQIDWNPEWSRRSLGRATYAALKQLGKNGLAALLERTCKYARLLVSQIGALHGAQIVRLPKINQGLVRFLDTALYAKESDHDRRTRAVIEAINKSGEAFFSATIWRGRYCMRVSVCNWRTGMEDITLAIDITKKILDMYVNRHEKIIPLARKNNKKHCV